MADLRVIDGGAEDEPPIRTREREPGDRYCRHLSVELDATARRVYCCDCKKEVSAFDQLKTLAYEWERYDATVKRAEADATRATEQLDDLRRKIRNAKAQLKRATNRR